LKPSISDDTLTLLVGATKDGSDLYLLLFTDCIPTIGAPIGLEFIFIPGPGDCTPIGFGVLTGLGVLTGVGKLVDEYGGGLNGIEPTEFIEVSKPGDV
jgi:hypothetical protein